MRQTAAAVGGLALIVLLGVGAWVESWQPFQIVEPKAAQVIDGTNWHRASGIIHVHTTYSDGGGDIDDVAAAAGDVGLDFVIVTDHNNFGAKSFEGYVDDVLVIVGTEVSTVTGHVLGLGLPAPTFQWSGDPLDVLGDIDDLGGAMFVAHPTSPRPDFRWTAWDLSGAWGIELVNGDTQWRTASLLQALWTTLLYPLNSRYALLRLMTRPTALDHWDRLLAERDVPAISGSDSHSYISLIEASGIPFPSYRAVFELARNHVVLPRMPSGFSDPDGALIVAALARGRSYIGLDGLAPADKFVFVAQDGETRWTMGDTVTPTSSLRLHAGGEMPENARISLFRDGQRIVEAPAEVVWGDVSPGVYRVEVDLPGWEFPWIISNPIYVFGPEVAAQRQERLRISQGEVSTRVVRGVDELDAATAFFVAGDQSTVIRQNVIDETAGSDQDAVVRLEFVLGTPSAEHPSPFAALTSFVSRDLSDGEGLMLSVKADGVYRLTLQVRDRNPKSLVGDGTEWWGMSIKTSTEWRRVVAPFRRFRTSDPASDGQLDADAVEGLVLLVDTGTVPPGTAGIIWFDDLELYATP